MCFAYFKVPMATLNAQIFVFLVLKNGEGCFSALQTLKLHIEVISNLKNNELKNVCSIVERS